MNDLVLSYPSTPVSYPQIDPKKVVKLYIGKDHCCRCGCKGRYRYADKPANKKIIAERVAEMNKYAEELEWEDEYVNWSQDNNRAWTVYFK